MHDKKKRVGWWDKVKGACFSPFSHVSEMVLTLCRACRVSFIFVFHENPLQLYPSRCCNGWVQSCHLARHAYSLLPMYAKHPKQSVNNKDFKWQARSRVNDKGQLASMQPLSVKDKSHGVTTHMGTWPIYRSKTHNPPEPGFCSCLLPFCQQHSTVQLHDPLNIPLRCVGDDRN